MLNQLALVSIFVITASVTAACSSPEPEAAEIPQVDPSQTQMPPQMAAAGIKSGTVTQTMDAAGYTYLQIDTGGESFWAAAPTTEVEIGDDVIVPAGMPMENFHSSALDRDFEVVYFVEGVQVGGLPGTPSTASSAELPGGHPPVGSQEGAVEPRVESGEIEPVEGGHLIGNIIANSAELKGETVTFRGRVVKFNSGIMGKNWLHVQDGSGEPGQNDLTVTTDAQVSVGQSVVVTGVVSTDRDFGFGYAYDVIIEDARVIVE